MKKSFAKKDKKHIEGGILPISYQPVCEALEKMGIEITHKKSVTPCKHDGTIILSFCKTKRGAKQACCILFNNTSPEQYKNIKAVKIASEIHGGRPPYSEMACMVAPEEMTTNLKKAIKIAKEAGKETSKKRKEKGQEAVKKMQEAKAKKKKAAEKDEKKKSGKKKK